MSSLVIVDEVYQLKESVVAQEEVEDREKILLRSLDFRQRHTNELYRDIIDD